MAIQLTNTIFDDNKNERDFSSSNSLIISERHAASIFEVVCM